MSKILERYEEAHSAFLRGAVHNESDEQLLLHLSGLANQNNTNTGTQHRDVIRGFTINNILLKRHIDRLQQHITLLNTQNARTQVLVIVLTVASLIGTGVQVWYAYSADVKGTPEIQTQPDGAGPAAPPTLPAAKGASK